MQLHNSRATLPILPNCVVGINAIAYILDCLYSDIHGNRQCEILLCFGYSDWPEGVFGSEFEQGGGFVAVGDLSWNGRGRARCEVGSVAGSAVHAGGQGVITIISPAFKTFPVLIPSLLVQTDGDWECLMACDGPCEDWAAWCEFFDDPRIRFSQSREAIGNYGHSLRDALLEEELHGRYVYLSNHDNTLIPTAVAEMNKQTADVVAWPIIHSYMNYTLFPPRLRYGEIDLCSVMARTDLAKSIGFPWRDHGADWLYIQELMSRTSDWCFLPQCMAVHN